MLPLLLSEFHEKLAHLKGLVMRDAQFPQAANKIKVAIGMRRSGKTYFIYQHILKLLEEGTELTTILYLNFEDDRLYPFDQQKLAQLVDQFYELFPINHDKKCYFFFDEIQNIENWALVVRRLHDTKQAEIFLTGSSAKLLSKEIATSLRGRALAVEIWPYSFSEFKIAKNVKIDQAIYGTKVRNQLNKLFRTYLSEGGFPEVTHYEGDVRQRTLQDYLDVVIYRDLIERHKIKHSSLIKYMILSMIHNVGKPFTINKFYNDVKTRGYKIGKDVLYEFAAQIEDAYIAFSLPVFNESIRKSEMNPKKIYAIDPGLIRALTLDYENDLSRLFENIIYLDLRRQGYQVYYYLTAERYEVDFLVQTRQGEKKLIQVAWDTEDKKTMEREQRALASAMKELQVDGKLITLDSYLREGL